MFWTLTWGYQHNSKVSPWHFLIVTLFRPIACTFLYFFNCKVFGLIYHYTLLSVHMGLCFWLETIVFLKKLLSTRESLKWYNYTCKKTTRMIIFLQFCDYSNHIDNSNWLQIVISLGVGWLQYGSTFSIRTLTELAVQALLLHHLLD